MRRDGDERDPIGQRVNEAYPLADFFLRDNDVSRVVRLLFREPIAPEIGEYEMRCTLRARVARDRSQLAARLEQRWLSAKRLSHWVQRRSAWGDTRFIEGRDPSERFKRDNVIDTVRRFRDAGLLNTDVAGLPDGGLAEVAIGALKGGELLAVIEYQRAVHAEAHAIDDATVRGVSPSGGTLYVTTYPCHLCYKHALSVRIARVEYIEPYAKSRAAKMYPDASEERPLPFAGVAPRRYISIFEEREPFVSDPSGTFVTVERSVAQPLLGRIRDDDDRAKQERLAVDGLKEEYR